METKKIIDKIYDHPNVNDMKNEVINLKGLHTTNMEFINSSEMAISQLEKDILELGKKIENLRVEIVNEASDNLDYQLENKKAMEKHYFEEMNQAINEYKQYSQRIVLFKNEAKFKQLESVQTNKVLQYNTFIVNKEEFIKEVNKKIEEFNVAVNKGIIKLDTFDYKLFNKEKIEEISGLLYLKNEKTIELEDKKAGAEFIRAENEELAKRISDIETNVDKILSEREDCKLFVETAVDNAVKTGTKVVNEAGKSLKSASSVATVVGKGLLKKAKNKASNFLNDLANDGIIEEDVVETKDENPTSIEFINDLKNIPPEELIQTGLSFLNKVKEDAKKLPEEGNVEEFKSEVKKDLKKLVKKLGENNNSKK